MARPNVIAVAHCPHCCAEDVAAEGIPITDDGRVVCRVIWSGMARVNGVPVPVMKMDLAAGMVPNRVQFPQAEVWAPSLTYCPNCRTQFYCGPDWRQLEEDPGPQVMVGR